MGILLSPCTTTMTQFSPSVVLLRLDNTCLYLLSHLSHLPAFNLLKPELGVCIVPQYTYFCLRMFRAPFHVVTPKNIKISFHMGPFGCTII